MKPEDVKNYYGSQYSFNKVTGMSGSTLGNWLKWGYVPEDAQYKLERITKGALKAETQENKEETVEEILLNAHQQLKAAITKSLFNFMNKYCVSGSKTYPYATRVVIDVLNELIKEVEK